MDKIIKCFIGKSTPNEDGTIKAVISTNALNRNDIIINPKGARLDNYRRNPVVLWNHNSDIPPIGKNINIAVYDNEIVALTKFANTQLAKDVEMLYREGFLNAFSLGILPIKVDIDEQGIPNFNDWELLEYSPVPIPADPNALAMALKSIQSPELKTTLNTYQIMENKENKIERAEIEEIKSQVEMLALSYDNIFNSAEFVDGYQAEVKALTEANAKLEIEVKNISEILNNKVKSNDRAIMKALIKDLVSNEMKKIVNKFNRV